MAEAPMRRQYLEIKRRYPDAIVLFRLGDFYETFDEDAQVVARELGIALTSRPVGKGKRVPLAGIPYHSLESYLARLIARGYKVAICEQMESPGKGKRLLAREVVRVVTPGTVVEESLLPQRESNYLAALVTEGDGAGIAYADISTGEFACCQLPVAEATAELERIRPAELLCEGWEVPEGVHASPLPSPAADVEAAQALLLAHFGAPGLDALGLEGRPLAVRAAAAVLAYLDKNQRPALAGLVRLQVYAPGACMLLDVSARRNLELFRPLRGEDGPSLISVLDLTRTAMGSRLLRRWLGQPLLDVEAIARRQDCVQLFYDSALRRQQVAQVLSRLPDLERLMARVTAGLASPRDLAALGRGLALVPALREALDCDLEGVPRGCRVLLEDLLARLSPCQEVAELIGRAIADDPTNSFEEGGIIRPGFSAELDQLRELQRDARGLLAQMEARERERTGIRSLKVGYNKVFGYYIEVTKANLHLVPADYERRQTLSEAERFVTAELKDLEYRLLHARERQEALERELFRQVCAQVTAWTGRVLALAGAIAEVDVYCALAEAAVRYGYVRPQVDEGDEIRIVDGRHPVVERTLPEGAFVPNDTHLSREDCQIVLLTGPNMAGKSTYLRQVALIVIMAQMGSFVPAREARIGVVDRIFTRIGASDDIAGGRSTFMVEMVETAAMLHGATPRSLLLFDEIGRGTSTYDGMAIARAVVEFLHNRPEVAARTLFATHYHELVDLAAFLPRVRNYHVAVTEEGGRIVFLHRVLPGGADRSYGVQVAELAGLPRPVVARAQELLQEMESAARQRLQRRRGRGEPAVQLPLAMDGLGLLEELASLDVDSLTPLEAITRLYELRERARRGLGREGAESHRRGV
ncbi:MAG TPA: DNA mismatch repair protein MutS [Dehalococcoidia bacterium]|nr:DNA mismatch repair protein MutS [Dehalococcoidia bacterium]